MVTIQNIGTSFDATADTDHPQTNTVKIRVGANTHIYHFHINTGTQDIGYIKSTDGGANFGSFNIIESVKQWTHVTVWYDRWTPDDTTGDIIHILGSNVDTDELRYFSLDTTTDLAGTNNDIQVITWTDIGGTTQASPTICKSRLGELFVGGIGLTGPAGIQTSKSVDSGATWSADITSGGASTFSNTLDTIQIVPLRTDDDVVLIGVTNASSEIRSVVYDNVANAWEGSSVLIDTADSTFTATVFSATLDKTTGDTYLVYLDDQAIFPSANLLFTKFSDTTRTWQTSVNIVHEFGGATTDLFREEKTGLAICRDQTEGFLMVSIVSGILVVNAQTVIMMFMSSDDGANWSDGFLVPTVPSGDYRRTDLGLMVLDQASGWWLNYWNDDDNAITALIATIPFEFYSGFALDADGVTGVEDVDCIVEEEGLRFIAGTTAGGKKPVHGQVKSTASTGAYKVMILPRFTDEGGVGTTDFQCLMYKQGASDADDEMDLTRLELED